MTLDDAVTRLKAYATEGQGRSVHLCNAYTLALARRHQALATTLNRGDLNLPDGTPLVWIGRRLGFSHMQRRVYGPDLLLALAHADGERALRHYLYGSTQDVVDALARRLNQYTPGIRVVGAEAPPFRPLSASEEAELTERVRLAEPDIVWVGLGTPRQDVFVDRFRNRLGASLVAVGAAFDFITGNKRQAPRWIQDRGFEWAFRLATEPRRLWRRYLIGNAVFLAGVARGLEVCNKE